LPSSPFAIYRSVPEAIFKIKRKSLIKQQMAKRINEQIHASSALQQQNAIPDSSR